MGRCGQCALLGSLLLIIGLGMLLNGPIPDGFQDAGKLRLFFGVLRLVGIHEAIMLSLYGNDALIAGNRETGKKMLNYDVNTTGLRVRDELFDAVEVRIYQPEEKPASGAAIFYMHGGGWTYGDISDGPIHSTVTHVARKLQLTAISVNYRLAPEHRFPLPLDDCLAAYKYLVSHASDYNIDANRIAVMGDSAGGNLAATMSLYLRDTGYKPAPKLQVLLYPATQMIDYQTPSSQENANDPLLKPWRSAQFGLLYSIGKSDDYQLLVSNMHTSPEIKAKYSSSYIKHDRVLRQPVSPSYTTPRTDFGNETFWGTIMGVFLNPYFAPLLADDLTGLPQAYVLTCEQDVLRDDGTLYARRLQEAGNKVTHEHMAAIHGIATFPMFQDYYLMWDKVTQYISQQI